MIFDEMSERQIDLYMELVNAINQALCAGSLDMAINYKDHKGWLSSSEFNYVFSKVLNIFIDAQWSVRYVDHPYDWMVVFLFKSNLAQAADNKPADMMNVKD